MNVFSIQPDWANGVTENLSWLTDVMRGQSGAEQRRAMRLSPRRTVEYDVTAIGRVRSFFDLVIARGGSDTWYLPLWWDGDALGANFSAGSPAVYIDTTYTEFYAGTACVIYQDEFNYEIHNITSVSTTVLQFAEATSRDWKKGTRVYPVRTARMTEQPSISKLSSRASQGTVKFMLTQNNDNVQSFVGDQYLAAPVWIDPPNERDAIDITYERLTTLLDGDTGITYQTDSAGFGFYKQKHLVSMFGRAQHATFRSLLYALRGQMNTLWLPTFAEDFFIAASSSGATLDVRNVGYWQYGVNTSAKQDIAVLMKDGTRVYTRITGSNLVSADIERLQLQLAHFPQTFSPATVRRISFMGRARLEVDSIDIKHETDSKGVSEGLLSFVSAPEIRNVV